jgi:pimeloyl-ACP methyl ester carboxylesterase
MEYLAAGNGPRSLLFIVGGPGSAIPSRREVRVMAASVRPYLDDGYTVWAVTRRRAMPTGYTVEDIADDHAASIRDELGGRVDVVVAEEFGGLVGLALAARHPECLGRLAVVGAASRVSGWGAETDLRFAEAFAAGRTAEAGAEIVASLLPEGRLRWLPRLLGPTVGKWLASRPYNVPDVLVEAEAQRVFDGRGLLPQISVPVVLIVGDRDRFADARLVDETAALVPDCTVVRYQGYGHLRAVSSSKVPRDVLAFLAAHPARGGGSPSGRADLHPAR